MPVPNLILQHLRELGVGIRLVILTKVVSLLTACLGYDLLHD